MQPNARISGPGSRTGRPPCALGSAARPPSGRSWPRLARSAAVGATARSSRSIGGRRAGRGRLGIRSRARAPRRRARPERERDQRAGSHDLAASRAPSRARARARRPRPRSPRRATGYRPHRAPPAPRPTARDLERVSGRSRRPASPRLATMSVEPSPLGSSREPVRCRGRATCRGRCRPRCRRPVSSACTNGVVASAARGCRPSARRRSSPATARSRTSPRRPRRIDDRLRDAARSRARS